MKIMGLQKLSILDYPETIASTIFTCGCNLLCPFCHNPSLVIGSESAKQQDGLLDENEILSYFEKRKKMLQGVCISGGEPLLQPDIGQFIKKIKSLGLKVKLDTNGCFPDILKNLIDSHLIDYVAMDIKNSPESYPNTVGIPSFDVSPILKSTEYLRQSGIAYEFRTTLVKELHTLKDLESIGKWLKRDVSYYLQNFESSETLINDFTKAHVSLTPFSLDELKNAKSILDKYFTSVIIRGLQL